MQYKNLTLIGTSHIAKQSIDEVRKAILEGKPDIVAVELDNKRLAALLESKKRKSRLGLMSIKRIGIKGLLFAVIGAWAQRKLGKMVGVEPGAEILTAVKLARKTKTRLVLIDQDIEITLHRFSMTLTWKEKLRFPLDMLKAVFFRKREMKRLGLKDFDLSKVPSREIVKKLTEEMKKRYPNVYKVLVYERNRYMAAKIRMLVQENPKSMILAVVGAGHEDELMDMIKKGAEIRSVEPPAIKYEYAVSVGKGKEQAVK